MFKQISYGLLGIAFSIIMTVKANWIVDTFGRISWAEKHFGSAGTYGFVRVLGVLLVFFFLAYMTGVLGIIYLTVTGFLYSIFGAASL